MKLAKTCAKFLHKHGGTILAVAASVGVGLTMWETGKATVKATTLVAMNKDENLGKKEVLRDCWKFYIPAAILGGGTIACVLGSNALNKKQIASLTAAYMALGKTYQNYRQKVIENIGLEKEAEIQEQISEEKLPEVREKMEEEKLLCYDPISKRYFHASEAELLTAFYEVNRDFVINGYIALNDFYGYLNLDFIPEMDGWGWSVDYMSEMWDACWINFSYVKQQTDDGLEVYYVTAFEEPIEDYLHFDPYDGLVESASKAIIEKMKNELPF